MNKLNKVIVHLSNRDNSEACNFIIQLNKECQINQVHIQSPRTGDDDSIPAINQELSSKILNSGSRMLDSQALERQVIKTTPIKAARNQLKSCLETARDEGVKFIVKLLTGIF